jgi:hypothetical protein
MKVKGKLIRRSLKTKTLSVAKFRLSDFEKDERRKATRSSALLQGKMTFSPAMFGRNSRQCFSAIARIGSVGLPIRNFRQTASPALN